MMFDEISEVTKECLRKVKGDSFDYEEKLISGGYLGSLDLFKLIIEIEKKFNIKVPLDRISPESFDDVNSIVCLIEDILPDNQS